MSQDDKRQIQNITIIGALSNIILAILKVIGGYYGQSRALIADGIHSLADLVTDFLVIFINRYTHKETNERHQYGYARLETAATAGLALFLLATGVGIIIEAGDHLFHQSTETPRPMLITLAIAIVALVAKEVVYRYTLIVAKKFNSSLLTANAWHHRSDAASSLVVIVGIIGGMLGFPYLDSSAAILVGALIIKMGWDLTATSLKELVDTGLDAETLRLMRQATESVPGVVAIHQLRSRYMGGRIFMDMHCLVSPYLSVTEGHYVAAKVHAELMKKFPDIKDVTVHIDAEDDELAPKSLNLPSRAELLPLLEQRWQDLLNKNDFKNIILHYLSGYIYIDVHLTSENSTSQTQLQALREKLTERVNDLHYLKKIKVFFGE